VTGGRVGQNDIMHKDKGINATLTGGRFVETVPALQAGGIV
jgi:hypothetical protein